MLIIVHRSLLFRLDIPLYICALCSLYSFADQKNKTIQPMVLSDHQFERNVPVFYVHYASTYVLMKAFSICQSTYKYYIRKSTSLCCFIRTVCSSRCSLIRLGLLIRYCITAYSLSVETKVAWSSGKLQNFDNNNGKSRIGIASSATTTATTPIAVK